MGVIAQRTFNTAYIWLDTAFLVLFCVLLFLSKRKLTLLFALCGGRESYYGLLDALARTREIRMTSEQVASYAGRWAGLKNFSRTPGGFTPEEAAALYRELFVK